MATVLYLGYHSAVCTVYILHKGIYWSIHASHMDQEACVPGTVEALETQMIVSPVS